MINKQKLQNPSAVFMQRFRVGCNNQPFCCREAAGCLWFWHFANAAIRHGGSHFYQAHSAVRPAFFHGKARVIAEKWDFDANAFGGFDDHFAFGHSEQSPVNYYIYQFNIRHFSILF
jgi:hypothetical protein